MCCPCCPCCSCCTTVSAIISGVLGLAVGIIIGVAFDAPISDAIKKIVEWELLHRGLSHWVKFVSQRFEFII